MITRGLLLIVVFLFGTMPLPTLAGEPKKETPAPVKQAEPPLRVEGDGITLAGVMEGEKPEHTFTLVNQGTKEMRIRAIRPWKRTDILSADRVLAPGGRGKITVALDTRGLGGTLTGGVTLLTTDRTRPRYRMRVSVPVTPLISVSPDRMFIDAVAGKAKKATVTISSNISEPLKLDSLNMPPAEALSWEIVPEVPDRRFLLTAEAKTVVEAAYRSRLVFRTNFPQRPMVVVPVLVRNLPRVQAIPAEIDFGRITLPADRGQTATVPSPPPPVRPVFIRMNSGSDLVVETVRTDSPALAWTVEAVVPGQVYRMDLRPLSAALKPGPLKAALTVATNQPGPPLVIPVTATGRIYEPPNTAVATQKHK